MIRLLTCLLGWLGAVLCWPANHMALAQMPTSDPTFMSIASGGVSGVYYPVGGALCQLINRDRPRHGVRCSTESSTGSLYNFDLLRAGEVNFAIVQSDLLRLALDGQGLLASKGAFSALRSLFSLHIEPLTIVVNPSLGVRSLQDLPRLRLNIGPPGSGNRGTFGILLQQMGWGADRFAGLGQRPADQQAQALCEGQIDGLIQVVGHPNTGIGEAINHCGGVLIPIDGLAAQQLLQAGLGYAPTQIQAGSYRRQDKPVPSVGPAAVLITRQDVDPALVRLVVSIVFENLPEFIAGHPALAGLTAAQMTQRALVAPLHEGALSYYRAQGWISAKP